MEKVQFSLRIDKTLLNALKIRSIDDESYVSDVIVDLVKKGIILENIYHEILGGKTLDEKTILEVFNSN